MHVRAEDGVEAYNALAHDESFLPRAALHVSRDNGLAAGSVPRTVVAPRVEAAFRLVHASPGVLEARAKLASHGAVVVFRVVGLRRPRGRLEHVQALEARGALGPRGPADVAEELLELGFVEVQTPPDAEEAHVVVRRGDEFVDEVVGDGGEFVHDQRLDVRENPETSELGEHAAQGARVEVVLGEGLVHALVAPPDASAVESLPVPMQDPGAATPRDVDVPKDAGRGEQDRPEALGRLRQRQDLPKREVANDVV